MISKENFELLKKEFGLCGSWAIWKRPADAPKSNTGDMEWASDPMLNEKVGTNFVFIGLNWAGGHGDQKQGGTIMWKDFHSDYTYQNDFKLRFALMDTPYWGSYITDIIKNHPETDSSKVRKWAKENPEQVAINIENFKRELYLLGVKSPILVAMGNHAYEIVNQYLGSKYKVVRIKHYSYTISQEDYRKEVLAILDKLA